MANAFEKYTGYTHREYTQGNLLEKYHELNTPARFLKLMAQQPIEYSQISGRGEESYQISDRVGGTNKGYYTEYSNVKELGKDQFVSILKGYGTTPYLVIFHNNAEILRPMSYSADGLETYNGTQIFWSEQIQDPRWGQLVKSKIFSYNLRDKSVSEIETEMPYLFNPTVSNDTLYAIEYKPMVYSSSIVRVTDLKNNKSITSDNTIYTTVNQITDFQISGSSLYTCEVNSSGSNIIKNGNTLLSIKDHTIKNLDLKENKLYFITDYFGKDVLCSITDNKEVFTISDIKIESSLVDITSYDVSAYSDEIYFSKYDGERGSFVYNQDAQNININPDSLEFTYPLVQELNRQMREKIKAENIYFQTNKDYTITPYNKASHLFHFHSWSPFFADVSGATSGSYDQIVNEGDIGLTAYSQNTLGTAITMLGYSYSFHNHKNAGHAKFTYTGWYPVIEASAHVGDKKVLGNKTSFRSYLSAYIPLNYSRNGWQRGVTPQVYWQFKNYENVVDVVGETAEGKSVYRVHTRDRHMVVGTIRAYSVFPIAKAQHFPRLGIGGRLYAGFSPKGGHYFGSITAAYIYAYLPGFTFNQGVRVSAAYQRQAVKTHFLDNFIAEPRGYTEDIYGKDYMRATIDYAIPIYLGDISLGPIAYLKSVNVVPFADLGLYRRNSVWRNRSSVGLDVTFRTHLFRIGYPLSIGFRYARTYRPGDIGSYSYSGYKAAGAGNGRKNYIGLLMEITFD